VAPPKAERAAADLSANSPHVISRPSDDGDANAKPESTQVTQAQRRARERRLALDTLCVLAELFPAAFRPPSIRPLKIGIRADLAEGRQRPSAGEGVPVAHKALTPVLGQRGRPVISLGGGWKGGAS
jgi:hypothetical protein